MIEKKNFYINGKWVSPSKPNNFEVINPSTEEPFAIISLGSIEDTDKLSVLLKMHSKLGEKLVKKKD